MASNQNNIKIHEHVKVFPSSSSTQTTTTIPLTFFDIFGFNLDVIEQIYFYTLHDPHTHPCFFFQKIVPNLKSSLSLTLQHFLPLAGKIVWPSESLKPFIKFNPTDNGDGVSFLIAESDSDYNHVIGNSPHEASLSRTFIPHLESSDSFASIISLQITLFPNCGFSIGITAHHAVFDGKSLSMLVKAWAYLCNKITETNEGTPCLLPELEPLFHREIIKDPSENVIKRSLNIISFEPKVEEPVRATFKLTADDLNKIKQNVLSKWEISDTNESKPQTLSSFILTYAYSTVCIAKAIHQVEKEKEKFALSLVLDCRPRLEPPIPNNYFGNCVWGDFIETKPFDFIKEDGVFLVAKRIYEKIKMINEKGIRVGNSFDRFQRYISLRTQGYEILGFGWSNRFADYEIDFGFGRPEKVEIVCVDRCLMFGFTDTKDANGGVEIDLVLNKHLMDLFTTFFLQGL